MKACPFCAEEIQDAAIVCKHCGRDIAPAFVVAQQPELPVIVPPIDKTTGPRAALPLIVTAGFMGCAAVVLGYTGSGLLMLWLSLAFILTGSLITRFGGGLLVACLGTALLMSFKGNDVTFPTTITKEAATAPPEQVAQTTLRLSATASFNGTQILVSNTGTDDWRAVKLEINGGFFSGGYVYRADDMSAGHEYSIGAMQFTKSDGTRLNPFNVKPQQLSISAKLSDDRNGFTSFTWK